MPPVVTLWDPKEVLEIGQEIAGIKCVGQAKTKRRRCRYSIARANYQQASEILLQMSRNNISAPSVDNALAPLARLLICRHWDHQDQVGEVVAEWRNRIQRFQIVAAAQLRENAQIGHHAARQEREPAGRERATARREIAIAHHERELTCREVEGLRRDVAIARQEARIARQETEMARRDTAIARQEVHNLRLEAARNLEVRNALAQHNVPRLATGRPRSTTRSRTIEASPPDLSPSSPRHPERPPVVQIDLNGASISLEAIPRAERRRAITAPPSNLRPMPTEEDSNLPSIGGDCSICLHDFGHEDIVRCAARCQQPFHGECISAWLEVRRTCPLW